MSPTLDCLRDEFQLETGVHFLNCAYLSPLPRRTEEAGILGMRRKRSPTGFPPSSFYDDSDRLRERFASMVGVAEPSRISIIPSVSYGIATAARNLHPEPGRNVVLLGEQFPSNVYVWLRFAGRHKLEVRFVERPEGGPPSAREWNARILEAIDERTAVVALAPVHWTDGTRFDLEAIGQRARDIGAAFIVDGSQSVGALPFDAGSIRPDALVCAGYKWLLGPYSIALAYYGPRFDEGTPLEETWIAREGSEDFQGLVDYVDRYQPGAARYDVGERSNFILVPMMTASLDLLLGWTPDSIQEYCRALTAPLAAELRGRGVAIEEEAGRAGHILGIRLPPGLDLSSLQARLEEARVYASLRSDALRVSPNVYNDESDLEALSEVLLGFL